MQITRDTSSNWVTNNTILDEFEYGVETDTNLIKIGDGDTPWNNLPYTNTSILWQDVNSGFNNTGDFSVNSLYSSGNISVYGSEDVVQFLVQGNSTQTSSVVEIKNSSGTSLLAIDNSGNITLNGIVDGRDLATDGSKLDGVEAGATADQTGSEIKTLYEAEADTNAYTDAEKTKLAAIEAGADVTDSTNVYAALSGLGGVELGSNLSGDRSCYVDLHASDVQTDFSTRIIRQAGENGNLEITNVGTGFINFKPSGLSRLIVSPTSTISYRPIIVDGTSNEVQLTVQGNATQTTDIFVVENSAGTDLVTVDNSGNLDVAGTGTFGGSATSGNALYLQSGDAGPIPADSTQIRFGYSNTDTYAHSIRTRHNSNGANGNAVDFYLWKQGTDAAGDLGTHRALTLDLASSTLFGGLLIDGHSDDFQLKVQGHSTQTNDIFVIENSAGTDLLTVDNSGNVNITGSVMADNGIFSLSGSTTALDLTQSGSGIALNINNSGSGNLLQIDTNKLVVNSSGVVGIGTGTPATSTALDISSTTGALLLPRMTTTERNTLTATNGMLIYNTTDNKFQGYENGAWANLI